MTNEESRDRETYLAHLLTAIGRVEAKIEQQLRSHDTLIQILMRSSMHTRPSPTEQDSTATRTQLLDRLLGIIPLVWQMVLWAIPRIVIAWGLAEGWLNTAWHWLSAFAKHVL